MMEYFNFIYLFYVNKGAYNTFENDDEQTM